MEQFKDQREMFPKNERWRDKACVLSGRGQALPLNQPVTDTFREILVAVLRARGHAIVDSLPESDVSIAGTVVDCALVGARGGQLAMLAIDLRIRGAGEERGTRRRWALDTPVRFRVPATKSNFVESLRDGMSAYAEHLAKDGELERIIRSAGEK